MKKDNQDFFVSHHLLELIQYITGQEAKEIISYFWDKSRECTTFPPNIRGVKGNSSITGQKLTGTGEKKMWVYKDYYPNSPIFFKMLVVDPRDSKHGWGDFLYIKVGFPDRKSGLKDSLNLDRNQLEKIVESTMLGTDFKIKTKKHRRMAPKGMKYV